MSRTKVILIVSKDIAVTSVPKEWDGNYILMNPNDFYDFDYDPLIHEVYPIGDLAYDIAAEKINKPELGFSKELSEICNDKFRCRETLDSLKDIPYKICDNNKINWEESPNTKLIAKPVGGSGSNGIHVVKHGDTVPDIGENYIVELYIDDQYPRVFIDGYILNGEIDVLCLSESVYKKDNPTEFDYFVFPSQYNNTPMYDKIVKKYKEVVSELHDKTKCDNQIIDIEFFIVNDTVKVMEINPRIGVNHIPMFNEVCGYCPWKSLENIYNNIKPKKTLNKKKGICLYNYLFDNKKGIYLHKLNSGENIEIFTILAHICHTYIYTDSDNYSIDDLINLGRQEINKIKNNELSPIKIFDLTF